MEPTTSRLHSETRPGDFPSARVALLLYTVTALVMTWPLALHLHDRLPMGDNDLWQNVWNFWWWEEAVVHRHQTPYSTDLLFQATAERRPVSLAFHTHSEANVLLALPVTSTLGPAAALNLSTLLGFILAGWGAYLLARELGANRAGAFVGGLVFAWFPHHVEQSLEHLNLASFQAMPLCILFLLRTIHHGARRNTLACGAFFALNALYAWHNGLLLLPFAAALVIDGLVRRRGERTAIVLRLAAAGMVATLLVFPFLLPKLSAMLAGADYYRKPAVEKGIDALFLIVPSDQHPLWGGLFTDLYGTLRSYPSAGFTCYVGWSSIALVAMALPWWRRRPAATLEDVPNRMAGSPGGFCALWLGIALLYVVLAFGDHLVIAGTTVSVPLPFTLLRRLPIVDMLRVANRFVVPAMLAVSVLAAVGATAFLSRRDSTDRSPRRDGLKRHGWPLLLSVLVLADLAWLPYPLREVPEPEWTREVREKYPGLLLNIPGGYRARGSDDMYLQTLHRQPLVGGYTSCVLPGMKARVKTFPILAHIFEGRPKVTVDVGHDLPALLDEFGVETVVVHLRRRRETLAAERARHSGTPAARLYNPEKGMPAADLDTIRGVLRRLWGTPRYADGDVEIYRMNE